MIRFVAGVVLALSALPWRSRRDRHTPHRGESPSLTARPIHVSGRLQTLRREEGFSTAELLGNAALGIAALVAIWGLLQLLGLDVIDMIREQILGGSTS